ncbi:molybdopterin-dependent oxidoreductase [Dehalogenimonas sp. THU2]|uniref:molybdopterin-dependent oxidoreductase n=1 Tax=Dehalogenimonas sp. THU2 TaxID=3151121 RepID=UPI00321856C3
MKNLVLSTLKTIMAAFVMLALVLISGCAVTESLASPPDAAESYVPGKNISDIINYRISVSGLVEQPLNLSYGDLVHLDTTSVFAYLFCPGVYYEYNKWTGVSITSLLDFAGAKENAGHVIFTAIDGYEMIFTVEQLEENSAILAYLKDGAELTDEDGYPVRLVVPDLDGYYWVRWLIGVDISS